jgi:hypothetical protein
MITLANYFGPWADHADATDEVKANADVLVERVNQLMDIMFADGVDFAINPATMSHISGKTYGGFRPQDCPQGSPKSSHKTGQGVDLYDPQNHIDDWCYRHQVTLEKLDLYMEAPEDTPRWCHLTTRAPKSGKRVFKP